MTLSSSYPGGFVSSRHRKLNFALHYGREVSSWHRSSSRILEFCSHLSGTYLHPRGKYGLDIWLLLWQRVLYRCVCARPPPLWPFGKRVIDSYNSHRRDDAVDTYVLSPSRAHLATVVGQKIPVIGGGPPRITACTSLTSQTGVGCARHPPRTVLLQHDITLACDGVVSKQNLSVWGKWVAGAE